MLKHLPISVIKFLLFKTKKWLGLKLFYKMSSNKGPLGSYREFPRHELATLEKNARKAKKKKMVLNMFERLAPLI